jgi:transposase
MPAPLRIILTPEEDQTLRELRLAQTVPQRTRDRAHTVRKTIRRWEEQGLGGLWEAPGRGAKPRCQAEALQYVAELLAQETRTYNSTQLVTKLKQERNIDLSSDRLRRLLKKNYRWKRTRTNLKAIKSRSIAGEYALDRFIFNCA